MSASSYVIQLSLQQSFVHPQFLLVFTPRGFKHKSSIVFFLWDYLYSSPLKDSQYFFPMAQQPPVGQGLHFIEALRSHSDTPHSVGLFWMRDRSLELSSYLTTHNTHNRQTFMPLAGLEPAVTESERWQTDALDRAATGIGFTTIFFFFFFFFFRWRYSLLWALACRTIPLHFFLSITHHR